MRDALQGTCLAVCLETTHPPNIHQPGTEPTKSIIPSFLPSATAISFILYMQQVAGSAGL